MNERSVRLKLDGPFRCHQCLLRQTGSLRIDRVMSVSVVRKRIELRRTAVEIASLKEKCEREKDKIRDRTED